MRAALGPAPALRVQGLRYRQAGADAVQVRQLRLDPRRRPGAAVQLFGAAGARGGHAAHPAGGRKAPRPLTGAPEFARVLHRGSRSTRRLRLGAWAMGLHADMAAALKARPCPDPPAPARQHSEDGIGANLVIPLRLSASPPALSHPPDFGYDRPFHRHRPLIAIQGHAILARARVDHRGKATAERSQLTAICSQCHSSLRRL